MGGVGGVGGFVWRAGGTQGEAGQGRVMWLSRMEKTGMQQVKTDMMCLRGEGGVKGLTTSSRRARHEAALLSKAVWTGLCSPPLLRTCARPRIAALGAPSRIVIAAYASLHRRVPPIC
jgi:hypothetical protein